MGMEWAHVDKAHLPPAHFRMCAELPCPLQGAHLQDRGEPLLGVGAPGWSFTNVGLLSLARGEGGQIRSVGSREQCLPRRTETLSPVRPPKRPSSSPVSRAKQKWLRDPSK